ncbi:MAG: hypothetical protein KGZ82_04005 [Bacteroidales bacterium]|nr:hypothetical protein [Bacteroidales bacterium]
MNKIDDLFRQNNALFEGEDLEDGHLERFLARLDQRKPIARKKSFFLQHLTKLSIAAVLVIGLGVLGILIKNKQSNVQSTDQLHTEAIQKADQYYTEIANDKIAEIEAMAQHSPSRETIVNEAIAQVNVLSTISKRLIGEYLRLKGDDRVFSAIMSNYMQMISGLDLVKEQIETHSNITTINP